MKLRVKRILRHLARVLFVIPFVIIVICIGYFVKPLIQNAGNGDKTAVPAAHASDTASADIPEGEGSGQGVRNDEIPPDPQGTGNRTEECGEESGLPEESGEDEAKPETEEQKEEIVVLSSDPLMLHDLYAERGETVTFRCFHDGAERYVWEYYDMAARDWAEMEGTSGYDDLGRTVSGAVIEASDENNGMMLRCRITFPDGQEAAETACLYVLDKTIAGIRVEDVLMDAEKYVSSHMIPVSVEYTDGTAEEITGLYGLHFLQETEQNVEAGTSPSGNYMETITTVIAEVDYLYTGYGENEVQLRYHPRGLNAKKLDANTVLYGTDQNPPVISQVDFSDYAVSTNDQAEIMVTVMAEDDITPYPLLQYAVLPKGQEVTEADWRNRNCFNAVFDRNGTWVVYCRDRYGNVGSYEKDVIVSDQDAPEILSVILEKEGWQPSNMIRVDAADALSMTYSFSCAETGEDSGFIERNHYEITHNGIWTVRVRDAAGNVSSGQISVTSIDSQAPVILGITTQQNNREVQ